MYAYALHRSWAAPLLLHLRSCSTETRNDDSYDGWRTEKKNLEETLRENRDWFAVLEWDAKSIV